MSKRKVILGPYQLGYLRAFRDSMNMDPILEHLPPINTDAIVYSSLIQCGAERFELEDIEQVKLPEEEFLKNRVSFFSPEEVKETREIINSAFRPFLPDNYKKDESYSEIWQLESFLSSLLVAAHKNGSTVTLSGIPSLEGLEEIMPSELLIPTKNLLLTFQQVDPQLPLPKVATNTLQVDKFEQIITSDLFLNYSKTHQNLEYQDDKYDLALEDLIVSSKKIAKSYPQYLQLKRGLIAILPITSKVIDTIFGKLPGVLAEFATNKLVSLVSDRKIIVYQFEPLWEYLLKTRFSKLASITREKEG